MAPYGRDTDEDEVQWSNELIVMERKKEKSLVYNTLRL
jgi:hypothetical protein